MKNGLIAKQKNPMEEFYKHTMKYYKKKFITSEGIDMFLDPCEIRDYEEFVLKQENKNSNRQYLTQINHKLLQHIKFSILHGEQLKSG